MLSPALSGQGALCIGFWGAHPVTLDTETGDLAFDTLLPRRPRPLRLGPVFHWLPDGGILWSFYRECLT